MGVLGSGAFRRAVRRAIALVGANRPLGRLLTTAGAMLSRDSGALRGVRREFAAALRMVREFSAGRYRKLPKRALIAIVAAVIYFLNPLDLVPDLLPILGLADDAVVLAWVLRQVRRDLDAFLAWEREWGGAIDVEGREVAAGALPSGTGPGTRGE